MKLNLKGIFKSVIAGATIIGGAVLGNEARKCFTKPLPDDDVDTNEEAECTEVEATFVTDDEEETTEPDEVPED